MLIEAKMQNQMLEDKLRRDTYTVAKQLSPTAQTEDSDAINFNNTAKTSYFIPDWNSH